MEGTAGGRGTISEGIAVPDTEIIGDSMKEAWNLFRHAAYSSKDHPRFNWQSETRHPWLFP